MVGAIVSYACYDLVSLKLIKDLLDKPARNNWENGIQLAEPWGLYLSRINFKREGKY